MIADKTKQRAKNEGFEIIEQGIREGYVCILIIDPESKKETATRVKCGHENLINKETGKAITRLREYLNQQCLTN